MFRQRCGNVALNVARMLPKADISHVVAMLEGNIAATLWQQCVLLGIDPSFQEKNHFPMAKFLRDF